MEGDALGDEAAEAIQIHQVSELQPITKGSAGGNDGISEAQSANLYAEVNAVRRIHSPGGYHEAGALGFRSCSSGLRVSVTPPQI